MMPTRCGLPQHVAVIMDGNGRWATRRGLPRLTGHRHGAAAVERLVQTARRIGVPTLTIYAFSGDNWRRPPDETMGLMSLFADFLVQEQTRLVETGIRLSVVGRRERLPSALVRAIDAVEQATARGEALHLRIAVDYSARDAIWSAVEQMVVTGSRSREDFSRRLRSGRGEPADVPDVDLLIRTGGELRLSDFLLWECAYAELCFLDVAWPDFTAEHFSDALAQFSRRQRRFGALPDTAAG
jgi:undecaprenyl diphosphate synthase